MDKVLITGANGFFASRCSEFLKNKYEVFAFDKKSLDITDKYRVFDLVKAIKPKYIVHTAAIADTGICERNPDLAYKINVESLENIAKICEDVRGKMIFISSDQIYNSNEEEGPYSEEDIAIPNTVYSKTKLKGEEIVGNYDIDAVSLRFTWLFGLYERNKKISTNMISNMIKAICCGEKLKLSVNEFRGMTYVYDIVDRFNDILNLPSGIYNTGCENNFSTYDIGKCILKEMGIIHKLDDVIEKDTEKFKDKPRDLRINNSKLKNYNIDFTTTEESIKRCIDEFRYKF